MEVGTCLILLVWVAAEIAGLASLVYLASRRHRLYILQERETAAKVEFLRQYVACMRADARALSEQGVPGVGSFVGYCTQALELTGGEPGP